jgi:serine/threonine protein kinase
VTRLAFGDEWHDKAIQNETEFLTELRDSHPNIVKFLRTGALNSMGFYFLDMEFCDLDLKDYIHTVLIKNPPSNEKAVHIWTILRQVSRGLEYLHSEGIVHRDVKPWKSNPLPPLRGSG